MTSYPDRTYPDAFESNRISGISARECLLALRRHRLLIFGCGVIGPAVAASILLTVPPTYTAETSLLLDARRPRVSDIPSLVEEQSTNPDAAQLRSEVEVLQSENLARRVIERLGLLSTPEFQHRQSYLATMLAGAKHYVADALSNVAPSLAAVVATTADPADDPHDRTTVAANAVQFYRDHLRVSNDGRSYVITLRYSSHDPAEAAEIVNTHVQLYLGDQIAYKQAVGKQASAWLTRELASLEAKLQASEDKVQRFREENQIIQNGDTTIVSQQLAAVNAQIPVAEADLASAESRLRHAQDLLRRNSADAQSDVLDSRLIQRLREEEASAQRRLAELRTVYGDANPVVVRAKAELRDLQDSIRVAAGRITKNIENEVQAARAKRDDLQRRLVELERSTVAADRAGAKLRDLQREVSANSSLIEVLLTRDKQVNVQEEIQQPDARVISAASVPINPSFPRLGIQLPFVVAGSLLLGTIIACLRELVSRGFTGSNEIEIECELPSLGSVPMVPRAWPRNAVPQDMVIDFPRSSFAEAVNNVRNSIQASGRSLRQIPKTLLVTSSLPHEGKSVLAVSLARNFARMGNGTLLIDCDARNPSVWKLMGIVEGPDISQALSGEIPWQDATRQDPKSTVQVIGADHAATMPHDLVSSTAMRKLLDQARRQYDVVILDSPPITAVSDALTLSRWADATMLVVRWGVTPREIARTSLKKLFASGAKLCGAVLTRVDMRRGIFSPAEIEYYHKKNRSYYIG